MNTEVAVRSVRSGGQARAAAVLGPADWVTLVRAVLAAIVAVLAVAAFAGQTFAVAVVTLAAIALALDSVDGWIARRTGTASPRGARFDMEVDAGLILALSVAAAPVVGVWVLSIGAARYAFVAATAVWTWLAAPTPARYWRKFVAAVQGVVLTVVAGSELSSTWNETIAAGAFAALAVSFGTQVSWLYRHRPVYVRSHVEKPQPVGAMAAR